MQEEVAENCWAGDGGNGRKQQLGAVDHGDKGHPVRANVDERRAVVGQIESASAGK